MYLDWLDCRQLPVNNNQVVVVLGRYWYLVDAPGKKVFPREIHWHASWDALTSVHPRCGDAFTVNISIFRTFHSVEWGTMSAEYSSVITLLKYSWITHFKLFEKKMTFRQLFFVSTKLPYVIWSVCLILDAVREILGCFRRCYPGNVDGVTCNDGGWLSYSPSPYHNLNPLPTLLIAFDHVGAASSSWGDPLVNPKAELSSCDASWIEVHPWAPVRISFYNNLTWVEIWPISFYQI